MGDKEYASLRPVTCLGSHETGFLIVSEIRNSDFFFSPFV